MKNKKVSFMKKIVMIISIMTLIVMPSNVHALNNNSYTEIEYSADGSYYETTINYFNSYARSQKSSSKTLKYYSSNNEPCWYVTVTGTYTYGNGTAKCTSSKVSAGTYKNNWKIRDKSSSKSGATAIAYAKANKLYNGHEIETKTKTVKLTCGSTGVLS